MRPIFIDQRHDITHCPQGNQIKQPLFVPYRQTIKMRLQGLNQLKSHTNPRKIQKGVERPCFAWLALQPFVGLGIVLQQPLWINNSNGGWLLGGHIVMIGDNHIDP